MSYITQEIALNDMRFFAHHGFYPEEQVLGGYFVVDIITSLHVYETGKDDLTKTVNYERIHEIATAEMAIPKKLIETVAHNILRAIRKEFIAVKSIQVKITKLNPPLKGEVGSSSVKLSFEK